MRKLILKSGLIALILASPLLAAADETPGAFKIPGTDTTISFNGFAETVLFYEFTGGQPYLNSVPCDIYLSPNCITLNHPVNGASPDLHDPQAGMGVGYARFGVQTSTPSDLGKIGTRFEMDAASGNPADYNHTGLSDTHSNYIRIRHAYGTIGDWFLMGQTWSNFADLNTFPDQMDENPTGNLAALRSPMIRFTIPAGAAAISLALEDPYYASLSNAFWNVPDLTAKVVFNAGPAALSVRGMVKQYRNEGSSAAGFGFGIGAAIKLGGDLLLVDAEGGPGIGTYMYGSTFTAGGPTNPAQDVVQDATNNNIKVWAAYGASVDYTHNWSNKFRSNLIVSGQWFPGSSDLKTAYTDNGALATYGFANQSVYTIGINTYWSPFRTFWLGPEFYYNQRNTFAAGYGNEFRGEFVSHFNFF